MNNNKVVEELNTRMSNVSILYGLTQQDLMFTIKCPIYKAAAFYFLLYAMKAWPVYKLAAHKLNTYMMRHLQQILNVKW